MQRKFCTHRNGFLSTPSARRATHRLRLRQLRITISIHALREEGDPIATKKRNFAFSISIHALREEGDHCRPSCRPSLRNFYPRPPRGGRLQIWENKPYSKRFLSTPSARRATLAMLDKIYHAVISIHALREEGDRDYVCARAFQYNFYPRPPRGGRRIQPGTAPGHHTFLSTPSARRATQTSGAASKTTPFLSTPSARRATGLGDKWFEDNQISIHALREEGDGVYNQISNNAAIFLSTPSARRATACRSLLCGSMIISIHALREEGDRAATIGTVTRTNFYPRPPRGGRQSGHPALDAGVRISIHALREEGDPYGRSGCWP